MALSFETFSNTTGDKTFEELREILNPKSLFVKKYDICVYIYGLFLFFSVPIITTTLSESKAETTTDTVVFTYSKSNQDGVFDFYRFTINGDSDPIEKERSDEDRNVRFTGLTAGTTYTVEAKTFSGSESSAVARVLDVTTGKLSLILKCS